MHLYSFSFVKVTAQAYDLHPPILPNKLTGPDFTDQWRTFSFYGQEIRGVESTCLVGHLHTKVKRNQQKQKKNKTFVDCVENNNVMPVNDIII